MGGVHAAGGARGGDRAGDARAARGVRRLPPAGLIAKMAVDDRRNQRRPILLGLGAGWNRREFDAFGFPYDRRVSRFEEAFTIIRGLLAGERVTLDGHVPLGRRRVLLPKPARQMPLMIGSNGPRMLGDRRCPTCTRWNTWWRDYGNTPRASRSSTRRSGIPEHARAQRVRAGAARRAGGARAGGPRGGQPRPRRAVAGASGRRRRRGDPRRQPDHRAVDPALGGPARRPLLDLPASSALGCSGADQLLRLALGRDLHTSQARPSA